MQEEDNQSGVCIDKTEEPLSPRHTESAKFKEMRDKNAYRRAANCCSPYVDGDPFKLTQGVAAYQDEAEVRWEVREEVS